MSYNWSLFAATMVVIATIIINFGPHDDDGDDE